MQATPIWPNGADGEIFRKLFSKGFDFSKEYDIDFNIDFKPWPPAEIAIQTINSVFPGSKVYADDDGKGGYVLFNLRAKVTYEFVLNTQAKVSDLVAPFGGCCVSWGVLH